MRLDELRVRKRKVINYQISTELFLNRKHYFSEFSKQTLMENAPTSPRI
jgi:hypothetical protein